MPRRTARQPDSEQVVPWPVQQVTAIGDWPFLNCHLLHTFDPESGILYLYGGEKPGEPLASLHALDTGTMTCTDLTKSLGEYPSLEKKALPVLSLPGFTFWKNGNSKWLLLWGGYNVKANSASSDFYVTNVNDLANPVWCHAKIEGQTVQPRVDPKIFAIGHKLFIFGGTKTEPEDLQDTPEQLCSYSVAEFMQTDQGSMWKWLVADSPYPANVPKNLILDNGVPIYDGSVILLTPGRASLASDTKFKSNSLWFFFTHNYIFKPALATGEFPTGLKGYHTFHIPRPPIENTQLPHSESVLVCGWVFDKRQLGYFLPKLWHFSLLTREFKRYDIARDLLGMAEMRHLVIAGHKLLLLGDQDDDPNKENYVMDSYIDLPDSVLSNVLDPYV